MFFKKSLSNFFLKTGKNIVYLAAGQLHMVAVTSGGKLFSWGSNQSGQLGQGFVKDQHTPQTLEYFESTGTRLSFLACGDSYTAAITEKGELFTWGKNQYGNLGFEARLQFTPQRVQALSGHNIVQVACGSDHTLALSSNGQVFTFGSNSHGQLGRNLQSENWSAEPTPLDFTNINFIACGGTQSCVSVSNLQHLLLQHTIDGNVKALEKALSTSNPNLQDIVDPIKGYTLLHWATLRNFPTIVQILIQYGSTVNAVDSKGRTFLHIAAKKGFHGTIFCFFVFEVFVSL